MIDAVTFSGRQTATPTPHAAGRDETARAFEAMVMRPMVEAMLPATMGGEDTGATAWRSMMVDALANALAQSAPLGLAQHLPSARGDAT